MYGTIKIRTQNAERMSDLQPHHQQTRKCGKLAPINTLGLHMQVYCGIAGCNTNGTLMQLESYRHKLDIQYDINIKFLYCACVLNSLLVSSETSCWLSWSTRIWTITGTVQHGAAVWFLLLLWDTWYCSTHQDFGKGSRDMHEWWFGTRYCWVLHSKIY